MSRRPAAGGARQFGWAIVSRRGLTLDQVERFIAHARASGAADPSSPVLGMTSWRGRLTRFQIGETRTGQMVRLTPATLATAEEWDRAATPGACSCGLGGLPPGPAHLESCPRWRGSHRRAGPPSGAG